MSTPRPARPALRAALFTIAASALVAISASPVLARPLASASLSESVMALLPEPQQPTPAPQQPAAKRPAPQQPAAAKTAPKEFKEFKLDEQAKLLSNSKAPRYPEILLRAGITGSTLAMFVVDTAGFPELSTFKIVRSAHPLFVEAVKASLPDTRFAPARVQGRTVRQLVQILYHFKTAKHADSDTVQTIKDVLAFEVTITDNDERLLDVGTLNFPSEPVYFIDGKRASADEVKKLEKERIQSVDVLKGEAARAKYGDDGKNGVVLITLKK